MKRLTALIIALLLFLPALAVRAEESSPTNADTTASSNFDLSSLYGRSAYFMNLDTGRVLVQKDADTMRSPASLTKIMTVLLTLENCDDPANTIVTIPDESLFTDVIVQNGARIYLKEGEQISVESLIYATMLKSACDSASALAWYIGNGNPQVFYDMMNKKAEELGMTNTHFMNAHGIDADGHYSTAHDMAILTQAALQNQDFVDVISTYSYQIPADNISAARTVNYTIELLNPKSANYYEGAFGVKSGYTSKAGRCLITTAERNGMRFLCVVLGANLDSSTGYYTQNQSYLDTKALYDWAFSTYTLSDYMADPPTDQVSVIHGTKKSVQGTLARTTPVLKTDEEPLSVTYQLSESVDAPVTAGETSLGTAQILLNGDVIDTVPIVAADSIAQLSYPRWAAGFAWFGLHPFLVLSFLILFVLIVLLYLRYRYVKMVRRRRRAARLRKISRQ